MIKCDKNTIRNSSVLPLLLILLMLLQGCSLFKYGIEEEYDEVKSTTRITKSFMPREAIKFFSPLNEVR